MPAAPLTRGLIELRAPGPPDGKAGSLGRGEAPRRFAPEIGCERNPVLGLTCRWRLRSVFPFARVAGLR